MNCEEIRRIIHETHDEDPGGPLPEDVREHLARCVACRELHDDLGALTRALRALPHDPLPTAALDAVWRDTIRSRHAGSSRSPGFWRLAAAAVLVTSLSTATLYFLFAPSSHRGPSSAELARASAQAELVFGYTARALAATRAAATDRVLASRVVPAVRGVPASHAPRSQK